MAQKGVIAKGKRMSIVIEGSTATACGLCVRRSTPLTWSATISRVLRRVCGLNVAEKEVS